MNISRRDQGLLAVLVIILVGALFFRFMYMPNNAKIQALNSDNQELELEKMRLTELKNVPVQSNDDEDEFAHLDKRLPTNDELIPLLTLLDDTINECKLPFGSLDYRGAEPNPAGVNTLEIGRAHV